MFGKSPQILLAVMLVLTGCEKPAPDHATDGSDLTAGVQAANVRSHMTFLADDLLEGRDTGTRGYRIAANYVATQFKLFGLGPAGANGEYFQTVPFRSSQAIQNAARAIILDGQDAISLTVMDDFLAWPGFGSEKQEVTAPLVYVGFGVSAPELDYDDYEGLDVDGKIVVMFSGAPGHFPTDQFAFFSSNTGKAIEAQKRGAVGIVQLRKPADERRFPWQRLIGFAGSASLRPLAKNGQPLVDLSALEGQIALSQAGTARLLETAGTTAEDLINKLASGESNSFEMGIAITLARQSRQGSLESVNVVALLEGSDPALKDEYVIYSAHLDHIGIRNGEGDIINNGAYDNAAGVSVMLETARAMAALPERPRRSVLFVAVTGEEKGLQGSEYFAAYPTVPAGSLVANINIDMPVMRFPMADLIAFGAEHSSLWPIIESAAAREGLTLSPDPWPEQTVFIRSDQFSFVKAGVPAFALWPGLESADPEIDGEQLRLQFMSNHYHQPSDDLDLAFNEDAATKFTRVNLAIGLDIANADERPHWNEGDFFGVRFGHRP